MTKKNYVGSTINGWLILEEIPIEYDETWSHQRIHNSRRFRVKNIDQGYVCERNIGQMRKMRKLVMTEERTSFKDLTGEQIGRYKVLGLTEESKLPHVLRENQDGVVWICKDTRTNEVIEKTSTSLLYLKPGVKPHHGARSNQPDEVDKVLYKLWQSIKQRCHSPTSVYYKHFGALGMTMNEEWRNSYVKFKRDVMDEVGDRPNRRYTLFVKQGKEFGPGNIEWVRLLSPRKAITHVDQYGKRLALKKRECCRTPSLSSGNPLYYETCLAGHIQNYVGQQK